MFDWLQIISPGIYKLMQRKTNQDNQQQINCTTTIY